MRNTGLDETQAGIKIAGKNINNLRHADDTTLMAESEKEESKKADLKPNFRKAKIMASNANHFIANKRGKRETMETVTDYFIVLQNHCRW